MGIQALTGALDRVYCSSLGPCEKMGQPPYGLPTPGPSVSDLLSQGWNGISGLYQAWVQTLVTAATSILFLPSLLGGSLVVFASSRSAYHMIPEMGWALDASSQCKWLVAWSRMHCAFPASSCCMTFISLTQCLCYQQEYHGHLVPGVRHRDLYGVGVPCDQKPVVPQTLHAQEGISLHVALVAGPGAPP